MFCQNFDLTYNITEIQALSNTYENKLKLLGSLEPDNKIGILDDIIYVETVTNKFIQGWLRKLKGQKREDINKYLNDKFTEYNLFLLMLSSLKNSDKDKDSLDAIIYDNIRLVISYIRGLNNLKEVYPDFVEIQNTCININMYLTETIKILGGELDLQTLTSGMDIKTWEISPHLDESTHPQHEEDSIHSHCDEYLD